MLPWGMGCSEFKEDASHGRVLGHRLDAHQFGLISCLQLVRAGFPSL
jgi:hypothetical protein